MRWMFVEELVSSFQPSLTWHIFFCRLSTVPIWWLKYLMLASIKTAPIDSFTIRHTVVRRPTRQSLRKTSAIPYNSQKPCPAPTTTFGSTTLTKRTKIGSHGACRSQQVRVDLWYLIITRDRQVYTKFYHKLSSLLPAYTAPDPPSNLSVSVKSGKIATITWSPPFQGNFTSFKLKVFGLSDFQYANKTIPIEEGTFQYQMKDLTPGASYQIHALTIFEDKESVAYTSRNFTTSKCVEVTLRSGDKITFHNIAAHWKLKRLGSSKAILHTKNKRTLTVLLNNRRRLAQESEEKEK